MRSKIQIWFICHPLKFKHKARKKQHVKNWKCFNGLHPANPTAVARA